MMSNGNGALHTLERNRFYYGKLMDVRHWTVEQEYGMEARHLLSRLGLGSGVLCGLGVSITADGGVWIEPGVAIDYAGREIVLPGRVCVQHPEQPTDCLGRPDGDPVTDGVVTIALCYHECLTEAAPAIECGCDTVERCEAGMVQEKFCVRVDRGDAPARTPFPCDAIFPAPPPDGFDRRHAAFDALAGPCPPASDDCVALATVTFAPEKSPVLDPFTPRRVIYSNQTLFELIVCLAARVDACCGERPPVTQPPRVMQMWPRDREILVQVQPERDSFLKVPRLELLFEREMAAAALADPDPWLRMWALEKEGDNVTARRVALTHKDPPGIQPILTAAGTEQLAAYICDKDLRKDIKTGRMIVQLRPQAGVTVDTGSPALLLDGEHHGTGLTQAQLDELWTNATDPSNPVSVDPGIWDEILGPGAPFPSGDGTEGGNLDLGFSFEVPFVPTEPRLRAAWPPSASWLRPNGTNEDRQWRAEFRENPHLELTFDDSLDLDALGQLDIGTWIRMWWLPENADHRFEPKRLELGFAGPMNQPQLAPPANTATVLLKANVPFPDLKPTARNHFVVVVKGDVASVDADFAGFTLSAAELAALWDSDAWSAGPPSGPSSVGAQMFDGQPGGTALTFFDYSDDA